MLTANGTDLAEHLKVSLKAKHGHSIPPGLRAPTSTTRRLSLSIRVELRKGAAVTTVEWPASSAAKCGAWLREWWMIRGDALWLSVAPLDMRASMDTILAKAVHVFGEARPNHAYLFANRRGTRIKVLIHDGQGIWLACRRLNQERVRWAEGNLVEP